MLLTPRRLPRRFNRRVTSATQRYVRTRHRSHPWYAWERFLRWLSYAQRNLASLRPYLVRFVVAGSVGVVVLGVGMALFSPILTVREMRILRTDLRLDIEHVQNALRPLFRQHLFFLSLSDVTPLLTAEMPQLLRPAVPDLKSVSIHKRYPSTLTVVAELDPLVAELRIREPGEAQESAGSGNLLRHYLTDEGMYVTYTSLQVGSGLLLPTYTIVDWGIRPEPWKQLIQPSFLLVVRQAEEVLKDQFGQEVGERTIYLRSQEFHLTLPSYTLWLDVRSPLNDQIARYRMFLQSPGRTEAKQYVDLRLKDRVVYK
jgi:hypothetical protein